MTYSKVFQKLEEVYFGFGAFFKSIILNVKEEIKILLQIKRLNIKHIGLIMF